MLELDDIAELAMADIGFCNDAIVICVLLKIGM